MSNLIAFMFYILAFSITAYGIILNKRIEARQKKRNALCKEAFKEARQKGTNYKKFCNDLKQNGECEVNGIMCYFFKDGYMVVNGKVVELSEANYDKIVRR